MEKTLRSEFPNAQVMTLGAGLGLRISSGQKDLDFQYNWQNALVEISGKSFNFKRIYRRWKKEKSVWKTYNLYWKTFNWKNAANWECFRNSK